MLRRVSSISPWRPVVIDALAWGSRACLCEEWEARTVLARDLGNAGDIASTKSESWAGKDQEKGQPQEARVELQGGHVGGPRIRVTVI